MRSSAARLLFGLVALTLLPSCGGDGGGGGGAAPPPPVYATPEILAADLNRPGGFVLDATHAYFSVQLPVPAILKVPKAGGAVIPLASGPAGDTYGQPVTDSAWAYWRALKVHLGYAELWKVTLDGGVPILLATVDRNGGILTAHGENLYWTGDYTYPEFSIQRMRKSGGPITTLGTGTMIGGLAVDDAGIYWTESPVAIGETGSVMRMALDGTSATTLASGLTDPRTILADAGTLYLPMGTGGLQAVWP